MLSFGFVFSCSSNDGSADAKSGAPKPGEKEVAKSKPEKPKLTDENAAEFLADYASENSANEAVIHTPYGDIRIRLYRNTPLHRANFVYLTRKGYFDSTWFYRVSPEHVIQAGNTDTEKTVEKRAAIGEYKVPSEIDAGNYHKRGAVAAVRSYYQNPEKNSDPYEFYIVIGDQYSEARLEMLAEQNDFRLNRSQKDFYSKHAGAPHLDADHTVFGEVVSGMDVVQRINQVEIDEGEWPLVSIPIDVDIVE